MAVISSLSTPIGLLTLIANNGKLIYCNWDTPDCLQKFNKTVTGISFESGTTQNLDWDIIGKTKKQINEYFNGKRKEFHIPLLFSGTSFQMEIWQLIRHIKLGETRSYKDMASQLGCSNACRALAGACGANPIAIIIPCHRVIASNGKAGGYTGGILKKQYLLQLEQKFFN